MEKITLFIKRILILICVVAATLAIGLVGQMDHDEYIEVNSAPKPRMLNY
jgi:hypothetical protein